MTELERVEYDGYYLIDVVTASGFKCTVPARGYNLKSWLNFELSLKSTYVHRLVTEEEYLKYHWTGLPWVEETTKPAKAAKTAKKAPAKKAAVKKAAVKKAVKKPAKKAVKKTTEKAKGKK